MEQDPRFQPKLLSAMVEQTDQRRTITFQLVQFEPRKLMRNVFVAFEWLPIIQKDDRFPLVSSVDDYDPSAFGPDDMKALQAELEALQSVHPEGFTELQAAVELVQECTATPNTYVSITPFGPPRWKRL